MSGFLLSKSMYRYEISDLLEDRNMESGKE